MGMMFGPILWIIVLGLVVAGIIWFVRSSGVGDQRPGKSDALSELDLRFAKGEIDADDYAARKKLLTDNIATHGEMRRGKTSSLSQTG